MQAVEAAYTVRELKPGELKHMFQFASGFFKETGQPGSIDLDVAIPNWEELISNGTGVVFGLWLGDELIGALAAFSYPDLHDNKLIAQEAFWFVRKPYRGAWVSLDLLARFEQWGRAIGAERYIVSCFTHDGAPSVGLTKLYARSGYGAHQSLFVREGPRG